MRYKSIIAAVLFMAACVPVNHLMMIDYIVKAGKHYSLPRATPPVPVGNSVSFTFQTDETWIWQPPEPSGFSKVGGIFWRDPHYYSARIGFDGEWLGVLFYNDGVSPMDNPTEQMIRVMKARIPASYYAKCGYEQNGLFCHLSDGVTDTVVRLKADKPIWPASFDQPYVGGRYVLDHDWHVRIKLN